MDSCWWFPAEGFRLGRNGAPRAWGRGVVVGGGGVAVIFGSGGDGGMEAVVRQVNFVYDICYE